MRTLLHSLAFLLLLANSAMAKRAAPAEIPAIVTEQAVFSAPHFAFENGMQQNGGVILAHDPKTKKLLWRMQIYKTTYTQTKETDVQDVFLKTLRYDEVHHLLIMSDETSRVFVLNLATKKVTQIR